MTQLPLPSWLPTACTAPLAVSHATSLRHRVAESVVNSSASVVATTQQAVRPAASLPQGATGRNPHRRKTKGQTKRLPPREEAYSGGKKTATRAAADAPPPPGSMNGVILVSTRSGACLFAQVRAGCLACVSFRWLTQHQRAAPFLF